MKLKIINELDIDDDFEDVVNKFCKNKNIKNIKIHIKFDMYVAFITYFEEESTTL